ncbi:hypothetical protein HDR66_02640 [bacterium]|nr:hypothetical protein [bacterium]
MKTSKNGLFLLRNSALGAVVLAACACSNNDADNRAAQDAASRDSIQAVQMARLDSIVSLISELQGENNRWRDSVTVLQDSVAMADARADSMAARADSLAIRLDECRNCKRRTTKKAPAKKPCAKKTTTTKTVSKSCGGNTVNNNVTVCGARDGVVTVNTGVNIAGCDNVVRTGGSNQSVSIAGNHNVVDMTPPRDTVIVNAHMTCKRNYIVTVQYGRTR